MLTITYCAALCVSIACWKVWRRSANKISVGAFTRRALVCAYWFLALTVLGDLLASLRIPNGDLTHDQFRILLLLAVGTMPQVALFALVVTPVVLRGRFSTYPFTKALILMEACAAVSIVMLAMGFIALMHYRESLLHGP